MGRAGHPARNRRRLFHPAKSRFEGVLPVRQARYDRGARRHHPARRRSCSGFDTSLQHDGKDVKRLSACSSALPGLGGTGRPGPSAPFCESAARPAHGSHPRASRVPLRGAPVERRRPSVCGSRRTGRDDQSDRLRSVVYLETAPRGAFEQAEPGRARDGPAQRNVRAARPGHHHRHDRRFPELRPDLPQRLFALEGGAL